MKLLPWNLGLRRTWGGTSEVEFIVVSSGLSGVINEASSEDSSSPPWFDERSKPGRRV